MDKYHWLNNDKILSLKLANHGYLLQKMTKDTNSCPNLFKYYISLFLNSERPVGFLQVLKFGSEVINILKKHICLIEWRTNLTIQNNYGSK